MDAERTPLRRPPPPFRRGVVVATDVRSPRLRRVTIGGDELVGLPSAGPAASVRLLLPRRGALLIPEWNGNEFLFDDGTRPPIRTLTPVRIDDRRGQVDVDIVLHGSGPLATWAAGCKPGDEVAISGTGRGYDVDRDAPAFLLAGDESALPAIATILDALPEHGVGEVHVELGDPSGQLDLHHPAGIDVAWHVLPAGAAPGDALVDAVRAVAVGEGARVWIAGEAASVQRVRRHLFEELGLDRSRCVVRGYWKRGRTSAG